MRTWAIVMVTAFCASGCVGAGPSPELLAQVRSERDQNVALAKAHKITFVEAANRNNASIERARSGNLNDQDRLLMSYRVALASMIDSGQLTFEVADYKFEEKKAEIESANEARKQAALAALGRSLQATARTIQPLPVTQLPPVPTTFSNTVRVQTNCTSTGFGNTVQTNCY